MNARRLVVATLFALALAAAVARADALSVADPGEVRGLIEQGAKVVDIRRADEWRETGVIGGSLLLTAIDAEGRLVEGFPQALAEAVGRHEPVVVICRSGTRSALISQLMRDSGGYTHVVDAGGGIRAWLAAGQPVEPCPSC